MRTASHPHHAARRLGRSGGSSKLLVVTEVKREVPTIRKAPSRRYWRAGPMTHSSHGISNSGWSGSTSECYFCVNFPSCRFCSAEQRTRPLVRSGWGQVQLVRVRTEVRNRISTTFSRVSKSPIGSPAHVQVGSWSLQQYGKPIRLFLTAALQKKDSRCRLPPTPLHNSVSC